MRLRNPTLCRLSVLTGLVTGTSVFDGVDDELAWADEVSEPSTLVSMSGAASDEVASFSVPGASVSSSSSTGGYVGRVIEIFRPSLLPPPPLLLFPPLLPPRRMSRPTTRKRILVICCIFLSMICE